MGSAAAMGDRVIQMESMDGAARCLEALRLQHKICNCRPLEFNTRLLEVASSVGAKVSFPQAPPLPPKIYCLVAVGAYGENAVVPHLPRPR
jgi:hypothetical protein